jgi:diaminopimelate epimerase
MQLLFQKMQGAGNEILIVDQRVADPIAPDARVLNELRRATAERPFDQLMWLNHPESPDAVASYRVFNVDGSEVEQCGNGVRCVAALLRSQDGDLPAEFTLESPVGRVVARVMNDARTAVSMGVPRFDDHITDLSINDRPVEVRLVSMGNPHCVLTVDDVQTADVAGLGPAIENHVRFPGRINVGFMQIIDRRSIRLRVYERGAGETLACGTGACAAVASGRRRDLLDDVVTVQLPGGQLVVSWRGENASMWLSGDVKFISEGRIEL